MKGMLLFDVVTGVPEITPAFMMWAVNEDT